MKTLAGITMIGLLALLPLTSSEAAPAAAASSVSGQVSINWGNQHHGHYGHSNRHHHRSTRHYRNPAVVVRQHGPQRHNRHVSGYRAAYRRPCEHVTVRSYDHRGRPYTEAYQRCFDARGYGFEVPGSRFILR